MSKKSSHNKKGLAFFKYNPDKILGNKRTRLQDAIIRGDIKKVEKLLKKGAKIDYAGVSGQDSLPLSLAIARGYKGITLSLIRNKAPLNRHYQGLCYLSLAAQTGSTFAIDHLLKNGVDATAKDLWSNRTPLFHLRNYQDNKAQKLIAAGVDINAVDGTGRTALYHAVINKKYSLAERLLSLGADPNITPKGKYPLVKIALENTTKKTDDLWKLIPTLLRHHAKSDITDNSGLSYFSKACLYKDLRAMRHAQIYCKNNHVSNDNNDTPLHLAFRMNAHNIDYLNLALNTYKTWPETTNNQGQTASDILLRYYEDPAYRKFYHCSAMNTLMERILDLGADPNMVHNKSGSSLLHTAIANNNLDLLQIALKYGADINIKDNRGRTPLMLAIETKKDIDLIDVLLDSGANPTQTNPTGWTILDCLSRDGDRTSPLVQLLIASGGQYAKQLPSNDHVLLQKKTVSDIRPKPPTATPQKKIVVAPPKKDFKF